MKSEWRVTSNPIGGKTMYAVYRLMDVYEVDHSGNREFAGNYIVDKQVALSTARALNQSESETKTQLIEEAKKIQEAWANLRKHGALGMYDVQNHDAVEINLWLKFFLQYFPEFEIVKRNCMDFPYQIQFRQAGVLFLALATNEELEDIKISRNKSGQN